MKSIFWWSVRFIVVGARGESTDTVRQHALAVLLSFSSSHLIVHLRNLFPLTLDWPDAIEVLYFRHPSIASCASCSWL